MTIEDIQTLIHGDETRTLELKKTTGELKDGMRSVCAFLNTAGGWLLFGIAPTTLKILGQEVTDNTRKEIAREIAKLEPLIDLPVEYIEVPDRPGYQVIVIHVDAVGYWSTPYTYDSKPYIRIESTTVVMPRDMFEDRLMRSKNNRYKWEDQVCEGITFADLEEQRIRGGVRLGVERGRMPESSLMETMESLVEKLKLTTPDGKLKNAAAALFLHDTAAIQAYSPTTPQDKNPSTPSTPSTSKREDAKLKRLKTLLSAIEENGASLKVLMEAMQRKDRKGFVSTYITPNIETGYIAMLYPETPNHPMQSYYLTNKGREALNHL